MLFFLYEKDVPVLNFDISSKLINKNKWYGTPGDTQVWHDKNVSRGIWFQFISLWLCVKPNIKVALLHVPSIGPNSASYNSKSLHSSIYPLFELWCLFIIPFLPN